MNLWELIAGLFKPKPDVPGAEDDAAPAADADIVAKGDFTRPVIDIYNGSITVAAEGPKMASISIWRLKDGKWTGGEVVHGTPQTAGRTYVPDAAGGIVSFRYGNVGGTGPWRGPAFILPSNKVVYPRFTEGAARLSNDGTTTFLMSKNGALAKIHQDGALEYVRGIPIVTGEKYDFVARDGKFYAVTNGWQEDPSVIYDGARKLVWADYAIYGAEYGNDLNYPSLCLAGDTVWAATVLFGKACVNGIKAGKLVFPSTAVRSIGPATLQQRCPPRLLTHLGNPILFWTYKGEIYKAKVPYGKPVKLFRGSMPDVVSADGKIHMVYLDGGIKYKTME